MHIWNMTPFPWHHTPTMHCTSLLYRLQNAVSWLPRFVCCVSYETGCETTPAGFLLLLSSLNCMFTELGATRGFVHATDEWFWDPSCTCCVNNVTCAVYFMLNPIKRDLPPTQPPLARCLNKLCVKKWLTTRACGRKILPSHWLWSNSWMD